MTLRGSAAGPYGLRSCRGCGPTDRPGRGATATAGAWATGVESARFAAKGRRPAVASALAALCAAALGLLSAPVASAGPRVLMEAAAQAEVAAVGRLNVGGTGHCTGTLIAPGLVLTAAHCLVTRTGVLWRPHRLHFLAGWRMGGYAAHMRGVALAVPEGYLEARDPGLDVALVRVALETGTPPAPIPTSEAHVRPGLAAMALSYGRDRSEALSTERDCALRARRGALLLTDCEATPGVSGAPLLVEGPRGLEILGVIVAAIDAKPPEMLGDALAVHARPHLEALRARLETGAARE